MPKKAKSSVALEKQRRTKRLVEISLRTDEFIYNNKNIPLHEIQRYLGELAHYKKCNLDVRSRQVVEKLTSLLREIIQDEYCNAVSEQDVTQVTPKAILPYEPPKPNQINSTMNVTPVNVYRGPKITSNKDKIIENASKERETIDLCYDDDETNVDPLEIRNANDISVVTAISNLRIREIHDDPAENHSKEFDRQSQSILIDFDNNTRSFTKNSQHTTDATNENSIVIPQKVQTPLKKRILERFTGAVVNTDIITQDVTVNTSKYKTVPSGHQNHDDLELVKSISSNIPDPVNNHLLKGNTKSVLKTSVGPTKVDFGSKTGKLNNKSNVRKSRRKYKVKPKCANLDCIKINKNITKRRRSRKGIDALSIEPTKAIENEISKYTNNIQTTVVVQAIPTASKSSNDVVEDLSWVENIKLVRIIEDDEYGTSDGYSDAFWNNLELPPDWDDSSFF